MSKRVPFGLSYVALAALASQTGCLSSSSNADGGSGGSSSSSGGGSSSGVGSGSSSGGSEGGTFSCTPDPATIIDDMSGAHGTANATGGYWYTYSDRTGAQLGAADSPRRWRRRRPARKHHSSGRANLPDHRRGHDRYLQLGLPRSRGRRRGHLGRRVRHGLQLDSSRRRACRVQHAAPTFRR